MRNQILSFADQLHWKPEIENRKKLTSCQSFLVLGMGGSGLSGRLLKNWHPEIDVAVRNDYGLPAVVRPDTLIIASSYSGNTEEVISGTEDALNQNLPLAVIASGGKLLELAKQNEIPYIELPDWHITPRLSIGLSLKALVATINNDRLIIELEHTADKLEPAKLEEVGRNLAIQLDGHIPLLYSSNDRSAFTYILKIMLNETAKIPAFRGIIPEVFHNEIEGFDIGPDQVPPFKQFKMIGLIDSGDNSEIKKRVHLVAQMYQDRGLPSFIYELSNGDTTEKMINFCLTSFWTSLILAEKNAKNPEGTPLIDELKSKI